MAVAKVAHPEHEGEFAIPHGYDSMFAKHQCLRPFFRLGHLDKHTAYKKSIHNGAQDGLEKKEDDALRAFVCNVSVAIPNSSLCLYEEEEGRGEVVDVGNTRGIFLIVGFVQVTPNVGNDPPHGGHEKPGHSVGEDKDEKVPAPLEVHQGGEQVRQIAARLAAQVAMLHVTPAILVHKPLALFLVGRALLLVEA